MSTPYSLDFHIVYWIFLITSFYGWGSLIAPAPFKTGLIQTFSFRTTWGMALVFFVANAYLAWIPGSPRLFWLLLAACGNLCLGYQAVKSVVNRKTRISWRFSYPEFFSALLVLFVAFFTLSANLYGQLINTWDDHLSYFAHIQMILDRGDFFDPLSLRRLASLGGQQIFQSFMVPFGEFENWVILFDKALIPTVGLGFVLWEKPSKRVAWIYIPFFLMGFWYLNSVPRINSASQASGLIFFLSWIWTLHHIIEERIAARHGALLLGLLGATLLSLRANYLIGWSLLFSLSGLYWVLYKKNSFRVYFWILCSTIFFMIPGMWMLFESSNTPFWPLIAGNFNSEIGTYRTLPETQELISYARSVVGHSQIPILLACLISGILFAQHCPPLIGIAVISSVFSLLGIAASIPKTLDYASVIRYNHGLSQATIIFAFSILLSRYHTIRDSLNWIPFKRPVYFSSLIVICYICLVPTQLVVNDFVFEIKTFGPQFHFVDTYSNERSQYRDIQKQIPKDSLVLSATDLPFLFDFKHHRIYLIDIPGQAGPTGLFDLHKDYLQFDNDLKDFGFGYLVYTPPSRSEGLYGHEFWKKFATFEGIQESWNPWFNYWFGYLAWKEKQSQIIASTDLLRIVFF